jgi:hypothetical protein
MLAVQLVRGWIGQPFKGRVAKTKPQRGGGRPYLPNDRRLSFRAKKGGSFSFSDGGK